MADSPVWPITIGPSGPAGPPGIPGPPGPDVTLAVGNLEVRADNLENTRALTSHLELHLADYGAQFDGAGGASAAANDEAIATALAAMPAAGGTIVLPRGAGVFDAPWPSLAGRRGITFRGQGGGPHPLGFGTGTVIVYRGSSAPFIDLRGAATIQFHAIDLRYSSGALTGHFIDLRGTVGGDTHDVLFRWCNIGDQLPYTLCSAASLLALDKSNSITLDHCWLWGAQNLIRGRDTEYVVAFRMIGGGLINSTDAHIRNGGESWTFIGVAIEPRLDGRAAFYKHDTGNQSTGWLLAGCWAGDFFTPGGALIEWFGTGLHIDGGTYRWVLADGTLIKLGNDATENNMNDIAFNGYAQGAGASSVFDFGAGSGHSRVHLGGYRNNIAEHTGGTPPTDYSVRGATGFSCRGGLSIGGVAPAPAPGGILLDRTGAESFVRWRRNDTPGAQLRIVAVDATPGLAVTNDTGAGGGFLSFREMVTPPAAPATNDARLFLEDNGAGKTRLMVRFATGAPQQIAIEP